MLGYLYFEDEKNHIPTVSADLIKGSLAIGMIVGQLGFGLFGDALGRHRIYGKELLITILGTMLVILMPWKGLSHGGTIAWMACFRALTGFGIGGDYPMTSALSAEGNSFGSRAKLVLLVFANIGLGAMSAGITYVVLLAAFKSSIEKDIYHLQWVWRLLFGIGLVPLIFTVYFRMTMPESKPYQKYVAQETSLKADGKRGVKQQFQDFREYFSQWKHAKVLFAVSMSWFLYDIAYYGVNLNQSIILSKIGYGTASTPWGTLWNTAVGNVIVSSAGYLPGFYIGVFLPDVVGRVRLQFWASLVVAILYAIWAGVSKQAGTGGLITLFTLSQLVLNLGPNVTTFLLPVEVFPTRVRGTAHGIAAASGKAGAVVTSFAFGSLTDAIGLQGVLGFLAGVMALVSLVTLLIPETKGRSLDEIERGTIYIRAGREDEVSQSIPSTTGGSTPVLDAKTGTSQVSVGAVHD
ncbi:hypothetical protein A1O3_09121 [Capronia epimyces CBS 606.96]|uniref:Major facilitator superfamily (MFS) profile domain-containing protein n=1 Tax=Capronia epimyces CBS 606.96 TaxID=1182542 RepID=W9XBW3_9EURO|nr:uncharacterized protein A1O3_09121 [Capronia epimyces CBS 606.96]EXJ77962.1 hypothetical protein A1O3_09121 [Capronia epimyces CBS 606.96]